MLTANSNQAHAALARTMNLDPILLPKAKQSESRSFRNPPLTLAIRSHFPP
jgi:hypothetical protein